MQAATEGAPRPRDDGPAGRGRPLPGGERDGETTAWFAVRFVALVATWISILCAPLPADADGAWRLVAPSEAGTPAGLALAPDDAQRVYLATANGLYRTSDAGRSWTLSPLPGLATFALEPGRPRHLVAVTAEDEGRSARLWRSRDRGRTWMPGADLKPPAGQRLKILSLALDPRLPARLAVSTAVLPAEAGKTAVAALVWWSNDGGGAVSRRAFEAAGGAHDPSHGVMLPRALAFGAESVLYAGTASGVFRSDDGGLTWQAARRGLESGQGYLSVTDLGVRAGDPDRLWAAVGQPSPTHGPIAGGSARFYESLDGGASWRAAGGDLPRGPLTALTPAPQGAGSHYAAVAAAGLHQRRAGVWSPFLDDPPATSGEITHLAVAPDSRDGVWAATAGGELFHHVAHSPTCDTDTTALCLGGRFRVDVVFPLALEIGKEGPVGAEATAPGVPLLGGDLHAAQAMPLGIAGGWFWFADPSQPAVAVRLGEDVHAGGWILYASALTTTPFDLSVVDLATGLTAGLTQEGRRNEESGTLSARFPAVASSEEEREVWMASLPDGGCGEESLDLCLHGGRFEVTVEWRWADPEAAEEASGAAIGDRLSDAAGWFRFLHPDEPELFVAVVDRGREDGAWEVAFASLSEVGFELTVTDRETGDRVAYQVAPGGPARHRDPTAFAETGEPP